MSSKVKANEAQDNCVGAAQARGMLIIVSSPSGGGKGTLIRRVLKKVPRLGYSVSFTTRPPRETEINGRDYFFVSPENFRQMVEAGEFLEWAEVHGHLYGTARTQVERELLEGFDIILEIDVQGAANVRRVNPAAVGIFILPPSFDVLRDRLINRGSESSAQLEVRLRNALDEAARYREFDYVLVNDDAKRASRQLAAIIYAERARRERQEEKAQLILQTFPSIPDGD